MNFARVLIGRGYTTLTVGRVAPSLGVSAVSFKNRTLVTAVNQNFHSNHVTTLQSTQSATPLKSKIQPMVSSGSQRWAHKLATAEVKDAALAAQVLKKRPLRKKIGLEELSAQGFYNVTAFATAEEYDLESLLGGLNEQNLYAAKKFFSTDNLGIEQDVLYVTAKYQVGSELRDIFFFRDGAVVLWNFTEIEANNVLSFLRPYEKDAYLRPLVRGESEVMPYTFIPKSAIDVEGDLVSEADVNTARAFFHDGKFFLTSGDDNFLQKYTFANAMASSIKLGIWEATLERYIDSLEHLTNDLKKGRRIRISRADVLRKTGELFALRHVLNLSSDLLDTPDFYWDREELEKLYLQVCSYFSISRRTKVMNEKINHCIELAELVSHNLNDAHHIRLEWMIIILIMVEVGFEIVHYMDRFYSKEDEYMGVVVANEVKQHT